MRVALVWVCLALVGCDAGSRGDGPERATAPADDGRVAFVHEGGAGGSGEIDRAPADPDADLEVAPADGGAGVEPGEDPARAGLELEAAFEGVDCFAAAPDADDAGTAAVVARQGGRVELVTLRSDGSTIEVVQGEAGDGRAPSACAVSFGREGRAEIAIAWTGGATEHLRREGIGWVTSRIAPFEATGIAMNARSPRGTEVIVVDGWLTALHAVRVADEWRSLPLPSVSFGDAGAMAIAVTADEEGRSHFALGGDYFGDRDGQYVFWPGDRARGDQPSGGLAIALSPTDPERLPHIVHARTERVTGGWEQMVTHLYRTVVGPDASVTTRWATAATVVGQDEHIAAEVGQLAASFDASGRLHTFAALEVRSPRSSRWALRHDRGADGADVTQDDIHATSGVAIVGDLVLVQSDRRLAIYRRDETLELAAMVDAIAPPQVGAVDGCEAGPSRGGATTTLRRMKGVSHAVVASDPESGEVHAVEWAWDREAVRHTVGHEAGWTTADVASWRVDIARPRHTRAVVDGHGVTHLLWPEGDTLVYSSDADGRFTREAVPVVAGAGAPGLAVIGDDVWVGAIEPGARGRTLAIARRQGGTWSREARDVEADGGIEAFAMAADSGRLAVLLAERTDAGEAHLVLVRPARTGWERRALGVTAARIDSIVGMAGTDGLVALIGATLATGHREIVTLLIAEGGEGRVIARRQYQAGETVEALFAGPLEGDGVALVWRRGEVLEGVGVAAADVTPLGPLAGAVGARLIDGLATPEGRLVAVSRRGADTEVVGAACAPVASRSRAR